MQYIPVSTLFVIYQVVPYNLYLAMPYLGDHGRVRQVIRVIRLFQDHILPHMRER